MSLSRETSKSTKSSKKSRKFLVLTIGLGLASAALCTVNPVSARTAASDSVRSVSNSYGR